MSIDTVFNNTTIALKPLWEAVLLDQDGGEISWTKPLITTVTTPKLKLIVNTVDGGIKKAYMGYELPDNISLTMYETVNRRVEKYLDGWMFGANGVFNKETGQFRTRANDKVTNLYRGLKFITTHFENDTQGSDTNIKLQENKTKIADMMIKEVQNIIGRQLTVTETEKMEWYLSMDNPVTQQLRILNVQQIASQLTAIAAQAANQVIGMVPAGMLIPRVVIPPPLLKLPAVVPKPPSPKISTKTNRFFVSARTEERDISIPQGKSPNVDKNEQALSGSDQIKKYDHKEKTVSITTYTCAIEGYEPSSYDYESGGAVTYTVNLSVMNYKTVYS